MIFCFASLSCLLLSSSFFFLFQHHMLKWPCPQDLGAFLACKTLRERHNETTEQIKCLIGPMRGSASGGTIHTMLNMMVSTASIKHENENWRNHLPPSCRASRGGC
jgi:hypothetical protein